MLSELSTRGRGEQFSFTNIFPQGLRVGYVATALQY